LVTVRFFAANGDTYVDATASVGDNLLTVAQNVGQPLEGTCEGQMACSTCHLYVDPSWFAKLPSAREEEEDMLDLATAATRNSRLACQITLTDDLDGLILRIPPESRNMQGR
jgi:ferredoxin